MSSIDSCPLKPPAVRSIAVYMNAWDAIDVCNLVVQYSGVFSFSILLNASFFFISATNWVSLKKDKNLNKSTECLMSAEFHQSPSSSSLDRSNSQPNIAAALAALEASAKRCIPLPEPKDSNDNMMDHISSIDSTLAKVRSGINTLDYIQQNRFHQKPVAVLPAVPWEITVTPPEVHPNPGVCSSMPEDSNASEALSDKFPNFTRKKSSTKIKSNKTEEVKSNKSEDASSLRTFDKKSNDSINKFDETDESLNDSSSLLAISTPDRKALKSNSSATQCCSKFCFNR